LENTEGYMQGQNYESRVYKEDKNYEEARKKIDKEISDYRILGLPGSRDYYAVTFRSFGNHFYSGIDPLLSNTSKPFIVYGEKTSPLYRDFSSEAYFKLLALFNVGKILVNEYLVPQYGFPGGMGAEIIEKAIDKSSISTYNEPEAFH
jgi:hypothetical protein